MSTIEDMLRRTMQSHKELYEETVAQRKEIEELQKDLEEMKSLNRNLTQALSQSLKRNAKPVASEAPYSREDFA